MSDKRISDLVELTTLADTDVLPVVDADANATKRVTYDTLATEVRTESEPLSATTVTASGDITSNGETVYHRGNVVGTVSESGGTPTGAIFEKDSNINGSYTRFADGTLICFANPDVLGEFNEDPVEARTWTFPSFFSNTPAVFGSNGTRVTADEVDAPAFGKDGDYEVTTSNVDVYHASTRAPLPFGSTLLAIGRWY